jgi:hypothetical protein
MVIQQHQHVQLPINNFMKKNIISALYLWFFVVSCQKQDDLYSQQNPIGPQIGDIISFQTVSSTTVDADGVSLCTVKVKINPEADAASRAVVFKVTGGAKLTNGDTVQTITANTQGFATASFYNTKAEAVLLKASVLTYTIDTAINFKMALPDDMQLTADKYVLDSATAQPVVITATLLRNAGRGLVTDGAKVLFTVTPLDTTINFIYQSFQYVQNKIAIDTAINPFKVGGRFKIEANTVSAVGNTLLKSINIRVR